MINSDKIYKCLPSFFGVPSDYKSMTIKAKVGESPYIMATRINNKGVEVLGAYFYKGSVLSNHEQAIELLSALKSVFVIPNEIISFEIECKEGELVTLKTNGLLEFK